MVYAAQSIALAALEVLVLADHADRAVLPADLVRVTIDLPAVLRVPSAVIPEEWNVLLNPAHPRAGRAKVVATEAFSFDPRPGS